LATGTGAAHHAHFKDADKYCKIIAGRVSQGLGCKACLTFGVLAAAVGAVVLYPNLESLDFKNISELINSQFR
jgi:COX assembly protein 1